RQNRFSRVGLNREARPPGLASAAFPLKRGVQGSGIPNRPSRWRLPAPMTIASDPHRIPMPPSVRSACARIGHILTIALRLGSGSRLCRGAFGSDRQKRESCGNEDRVLRGLPCAQVHCHSLDSFLWTPFPSASPTDVQLRADFSLIPFDDRIDLHLAPCTFSF